MGDELYIEDTTENKPLSVDDIHQSLELLKLNQYEFKTKSQEICQQMEEINIKHLSAEQNPKAELEKLNNLREHERDEIIKKDYENDANDCYSIKKKFYRRNK